MSAELIGIRALETFIVPSWTLAMASDQYVLLLVGPIESDDPLPAEVVKGLRNHPGIRLAGAIVDVAPYSGLWISLLSPPIAGIPQAPLEASLRVSPTVGYAATGTIDAVIDGVTGLLAPVGCIDGLTGGLLRLLENEILRQTLGANARAYVRHEFPAGRGAETLLDFYSHCLARL